MPILQDYDTEIKPILEEYEKTMEVVDYAALAMSQQEHDAYSA